MLKLISLSQQAFHLGKRVHCPSAPGNSSPLPNSAQQPNSRASQSSRQPPRRTSAAPILRGLGRVSGAAVPAGGGAGAPVADRVKSCRAPATLGGSGTLTPVLGRGGLWVPRWMKWGTRKGRCPTGLPQGRRRWWVSSLVSQAWQKMSGGG